jgi:hypothetical protein
MRKENAVADKREARKGSITAMLIAVLSRENVPSDDKIVAMVKESHRGTKFSRAHLAWYKTKFRSGLLTGMDKRSHVIKQAARPKAAEKRAERKPKKKA